MAWFIVTSGASVGGGSFAWSWIVLTPTISNDRTPEGTVTRTSGRPSRTSIKRRSRNGSTILMTTSP